LSTARTKPFIVPDERSIESEEKADAQIDNRVPSRRRGPQKRG
jgi:hypothetical protein